METGRVISGRYLLQRLVKQTPFCSVYQGMDQRLQRAVAVKSVLAPHHATYKTAVKMTANFSHPYIIGLYDLVVEPESLYVVQEYVDGDSFEKVLQSSLNAFEIAEMGWQMCLALMYAGSSSRRVCHGDLTPASLIRDRQGVIKINDFALPCDLNYFQRWGVMGTDGAALLETELPWGQQSPERKADDTRAVGLLLYQLLTGSAEPPPDGRLRFARGIPPELCETVARTVIRQHPQHIDNAETLHAHLKQLADALEPPTAAPALVTYQQEEPLVRQFSPAGAARGAATLPSRENEHAGRSLSSYSGKLPSLEAAPSAPTMMNAYNADHPQVLSQTDTGPKSSSPALMILLLGLLAFALFFVVGYFLGHALIR